MTNSKGKMQSFLLGKSNKLTYQNDSRTIGKASNFVLSDEKHLFSTRSNEILATLVGGTDKDDEYFKV